MQRPATTSMPTSMSMPMKKDMEHPATSSMPMPMPMKRDKEHPSTSSMSMSMPMKREASVASATPSSSMRVESPEKAERMMMLYAISRSH